MPIASQRTGARPRRVRRMPARTAGAVASASACRGPMLPCPSCAGEPRVQPGELHLGLEMRFSNRTLARDGCAVARSNPPARRLLASVAMPAADAAPCALRRRAGAAARTSCDDENLPARDGCAPARSNRRHCRLLASVAMLLMPRRWRAAGTAAPRVAAPRAARLGLQLLGRRGFCYGYDDVSVASVSTGCWDQTRKWSGPSCMRERVGGWRRRVCLCPGRCETSSMCVKLIIAR
jgi:hypothetical protein